MSWEKAVPWWSAKSPPPGWLAVSATVLQMAQGHWHPALGWQPEDAYAWWQGHVPAATIGYSIWVFDLRRPRTPPHRVADRTSRRTAREMTRHTTARPDMPP
jgi:hypothetical protein